MHAATTAQHRHTSANRPIPAGAVEVKQEGQLVAHVEQAEKEAFAMWCYNALRGSFDPVWVVLTDLSKVCVLA